MAKTQSTTKTVPTETPKPEIPMGNHIPVDVKDAWDESFVLVQGIYGILSIAGDSDEGLTPEGCQALNVIADHLVSRAKIVNHCFTGGTE